MVSLNLYNQGGKKVGRVKLPKEIFEAKINNQLMAQAVKVYLANQRKAQAKTKTRAEVIGSRKKIYRQKGTGRARHADRYAPIFVGGGIAHGPRGEKIKLKMPKKMRRLALFSALTSKLKEKKLIIVEKLEKMKPKTKEIIKIMRNLECKVKNGKLKEKILLVLPKTDESIIRAAKNVNRIKSIQANLLNAYEVLNGGKLILTKDCLKILKKTFLT